MVGASCTTSPNGNILQYVYTNHGIEQFTSLQIQTVGVGSFSIMVDYSKWDRMDFSDSDDDSSQHAPRVTSLNSPGRVTIGTDGSLEIGKSSLPSNRPGVMAVPAVTSEKAKTDETKKRKFDEWKTKLTHNGGHHHITIRTDETKEVKLPIYWSQDRYAVTLRLGFSHFVFPSKSIRVRVRGSLDYKDRFSAVGSGAMSGYKEEGPDDSMAFGEIEIVSTGVDKSETLLLSGKLPRPIYRNQDEDEIGFDIEDKQIYEDTTGETKCTKFVTVSLPKAVPMEGMMIWWEHALLDLPKIDTSMIQERNNVGNRVMSIEEYNECMDKKKSSALGDRSKKEAFAKAWNEAHQMFREKVEAREKQEIHVED